MCHQHTTHDFLSGQCDSLWSFDNQTDNPISYAACQYEDSIQYVCQPVENFGGGGPSSPKRVAGLNSESDRVFSNLNSNLILNFVQGQNLTLKLTQYLGKN